jgi:EAL domain-containing protein (putative c-di-GMP-specific phosphodiesterase class I)
MSAIRLKESVKEEDVVSRMGGDEFVILLQNVTSEKQVESVAKRILEKFRKPFSFEGQEVYINTSTGISIYPKDGEDVISLFKSADNALYRVKEEGGSGFKRFSGNFLAQEPVQRWKLEKELRSAIQRFEFDFDFQPIYKLARHRSVIESEALLRWHHPKLGTMLPHTFVRQLEESGLISQLTQWQLKKICQVLSELKSLNKMMPIALNISARQILQQDFLEEIERALRKFNIEPKYLILEITETFLIKNLDTSKELLKNLHALGVMVMIDDFGTGHASLNYLKQLQVVGLKIDQSFTQNMLTSKTDLAIVKAILSLGENLGMKVIAEGVETLKQHRMLKSLKCSFAQGNWYNKPVSLNTLLRKHVNKKSWKAKL